MKLVVLGLLLLGEAAGARVYTVPDGFGSRRYFGPAACYHAVPEGLRNVRKGQPFGEAVGEFFFHAQGGETSLTRAEPVPPSSELQKAGQRPELTPAPRSFVVQAAPGREAPPSLRLPVPLSRDASPVRWSHLDSKK